MLLPHWSIAVVLSMLLWVPAITRGESPQSGDLLTQLQAMSSSQLVRQASERGDARRGALLFHQAELQCAKCHTQQAATESTRNDSDAALVGSVAPGLGPNLASYPQRVEREYLIESILNPSRLIRDGFHAVNVLTKDGRQIMGIVVSESATELVLRDISGDGSNLVLNKEELEQITRSGQSIMPSGLVNQLGSVDQFWDLAKYVMEIAEQGPKRAAELQPPRSLVQTNPLPEYESHLDHAGLISRFDKASFARGQQIYRRVCANCHGTAQTEGSLPTAPRFALAKSLKNGSDPYRLYQTLTHGFGLMVAQRWMVPQQKYDVIHYLREEFFQSSDNLYTDLSPMYLERLPRGDTFGPEPSRWEPYIAMDYGPAMHHTFEIKLNNSGADEDVGWDLGRSPRASDPWAEPDQYFAPGEAPNFAYKGIAVRLDDGGGGVTRGSHWLVYDHDTLNAQAAWHGDSFIDYSCIQFDGRHGCHNRLTGEIDFENPVGPGWAQPLTGSFADPRPVGRDGRPYGPLPSSWMRYRGLYHFGRRVVLSYSVGSAPILESPTVEQATVGQSRSDYDRDEKPAAKPIYTRTLNIGAATHRLSLRAAPANAYIRVIGEHADTVSVGSKDGFQVVHIAPRQHPVRIQVQISASEFEPFDTREQATNVEDLSGLTLGSPPHWPERVTTSITTVHDEIFTVDEIRLPESNPWSCQMRTTGHDIFPDNRTAAICTWDGDVWLVEGIDQRQGSITWQRIASGLFQPLGLKIVAGTIYVTCRDQLVALRDLNGDRETDFYECFNSDHQVTEHFHEFAMGLQVDADGNFYYAKSGRHAKRAVVPHHGTLLKVTADGQHTEILATGFRAANGVCLNTDGSFFVTDQEGHWNPKNRINWVTPGGFYGNLYSFTDICDPSDEAMSQPLCWITNDFDRSPAELLWVPKDAWGPLGGTLLNLSYGYGRIFVVPHERVEGQLQGGMCQLPIPDFPSGLVRGRFHGHPAALYVCGMFSWAGSRTAPGSFHRIRYEDRPAHLPLGLKASERQIEITFSHPLNRDAAENVEHYSIEVWDIHRTPNYGSDHHNQRALIVSQARLSEDQRTVTLTVADLVPTWCMSINYQLLGANGRSLTGEIHNSIFQLPSPKRLASTGK